MGGREEEWRRGGEGERGAGRAAAYEVTSGEEKFILHLVVC